MITVVYPKGAQREGAYRALENAHMSVVELERTRDVACMQRMEVQGGTCMVVLDKTSIQLADREGERNFGAVGNRRYGAQGVQVLTGLALDGVGAPLGVAHQQLWARGESSSPPRVPGHASRKRKRDTRTPEERESHLWVVAMREVHELAEHEAPHVRLWFHIDREGDCWGVHKLAAELGVWTTVRMTKEHVVQEAGEAQASMKGWIRRKKIAVWLDIHLPAHDGLPARDARLAVRYGEARLRLPIAGEHRWVTKYFVHVDEATRPNAEDRIEWFLSTTRPVHDIDDAREVIQGYKWRWRIEDFHRTWKSGCCNIESSQLHSLAVFHRWAIITSSMAARAEYIKHHSRESPDAPATIVYTRDEIDTVIEWRLLETPKAKTPYKPSDTPKLSEMTRWVAQFGGYMKSSKAAPPGATTIARGLAYLAPLVAGRKMRSERIARICG